MSVWKKVPELNYEVSESGHVRSLHDYHEGRYLTPKMDRDGMLVVVLQQDNEQHHTAVSRLIAEAFVPNPKDLPMACQIDGDPLNCHYENLEWRTNSDNQIAVVVSGDHDSSKVVQQFTEDNEFIAQFPSARHVTRVLGYDGSYISKVCRGERPGAHGFLWRYKNDS